jgi:predicted DNA-binding antitoxin AbrB/MazE fold protein
VVWLHGLKSESMYLKKIHCRKQWCPECGGKGGRIHKSRLHSVMSRVDIEKYYLRQFVFTVPEETRESFKSFQKLSKLETATKETIEYFFGEPVFDRRGHVKKRKLTKGVMSYFHPFGDKERGVFKPHMNVHIFERKGEKMKIEKAVLDAMRAYWLKKLKAITGNEELSVVDVHYSFRMSAKKNMHAIKYMSRPWSAEDYAAIKDEELKKLLVIELKGFLYLRFWGSLANCKYKDEMSLPEIKKEVESVVGEPLKMLFVAPFDKEKWASKIDLIGDDLFRLKAKYSREELWNYRECMEFFDGKRGFNC